MADERYLGKDYQLKREQVLELWDQYLAFRGDVDDLSSPTVGEDVRHGEFRLLIAGEVKAGKSTLINALLGEEVLPTDALQCSSAVVEIFRADSPYLETTFADGHNERSNDIRTALRKSARVEEGTRGIPTALLDSWIAEGRATEPLAEVLAELERISKLDLADKKDEIASYLQTRKPHDIPMVIRLGYPLKYFCEGLRIVDSPGVNAVGGIENKTFSYLNNASAILFAHSVEGAIESASFSEFVNSSPKHAKDVLFLVLTKSGNRNPREIASKLQDAGRRFVDVQRRGRLLAADSLQRIIAAELERAQDFDRLCVDYQQRQDSGESDEAVLAEIKEDLVSRAQRKSKTTSWKELADYLMQQSNFGELERLIEDCVLQLPAQQLVGVLRSMETGYRNQQKSLEARVKDREIALRDPQELAERIAQRERVLDDYNEKIQQLDLSLPRTGAEILQQLSRVGEEHIQQLGQATGEADVRRVLANFNQQLHQVVEQTIEQYTQQLSEQMRLEGLAGQFRRVNLPWLDADQAITLDFKQFEVRQSTLTQSSQSSQSSQSGGMLSLLGPVGGAIGGALLAGPVGAAIGSGLGGVLGKVLFGTKPSGSGGQPPVVFDRDAYARGLRDSVAPAIRAHLEQLPAELEMWLSACGEEVKKRVGQRVAAEKEELRKLQLEKEENDELARKLGFDRRRLQQLEERLSQVLQQAAQMNNAAVAVVG